MKSQENCQISRPLSRCSSVLLISAYQEDHRFHEIKTINDIILNKINNYNIVIIIIKLLLAIIYTWTNMYGQIIIIVVIWIKIRVPRASDLAKHASINHGSECMVSPIQLSESKK